MISVLDRTDASLTVAWEDSERTAELLLVVPAEIGGNLMSYRPPDPLTIAPPSAVAFALMGDARRRVVEDLTPATSHCLALYGAPWATDGLRRLIAHCFGVTDPASQ